MAINAIKQHILLNGDCLEEMFHFEKYKVNMVLADLPYGKIANKWDIPINLHVMWWHFTRILEDNVPIVLFASQPFTSDLINTNKSDFKYEWIWRKNTTSNFALAKKQPLRNHESILIFYKKQPKYNYIKEQRELNYKSEQRMKYKFTTDKGNNTHQNGLKKIVYIPENKEMSYPKTVKRWNSVSSYKRFHPTEKPVEALEYLIRTYTDEHDTVLDITMGCGSTGIACKNLNRKFIGIEKDKKYFEISKQRIEDSWL